MPKICCHCGEEEQLHIAGSCRTGKAVFCWKGSYSDNPAEKYCTCGHDATYHNYTTEGDYADCASVGCHCRKFTAIPEGMTQEQFARYMEGVKSFVIGQSEVAPVLPIHKKPPLGPMPRKLWQEQRMADLIGAMYGALYRDDGSIIPQEWFTEAAEISAWLQANTKP